MNSKITTKISFLDVLVVRSNGSIETTVFRKKIASNTYINFNSFHAPSQKSGVVYGLIHRAVHLCSNPQLLSNELAKIRSDLRNSEFPPNFIEYHLNAAMQKFNFQNYNLLQCVYGPATPSNSNLPSDKPRKYVSVPYIHKTDRSVTKILREADIGVGFKPGRKLSSFFNLHKPPIENNKRGGSIYQINCKDCSLSYVGETGRALETRIKEHKRAIAKNRLAYATAAHATASNHTFDTENPQVLANDQNWNRRLWLEAAFIQSKPTCLNSNIGKRTISESWNIHLFNYNKLLNRGSRRPAT